MAVANVAWILASNGYKVLLIDWDLEAPGLHRYLRPFLTDPELTSTAGLIDFASRAARRKSAPFPDGDVVSNSELSSLKDCTVSVNWTFRDGGSIEFIPAGQQDKSYAERVNTFNWWDFYERLGGKRLLAAERDALKANYDYVLIDGRTGVSDTSNICTLQMPDLVVIPFTLNRQSISGAVAAAACIQAKRELLPIFPIPTRVEYGEQEKLSAAMAYARRAFAPFLVHVQSDQRAIDPNQQASYWRDVETPYISFYAFEEIPAAFKDETGSRRGLLAPNERISYWITEKIVKALKPQNDGRRSEIIQAYGFKTNEAIPLDWKPRSHQSILIDKTVNIVRRWLRRHGWQYAAIVLAGAMLVLVSLFSVDQTRRSRQIVALSSQLTDAVGGLRKVQIFASEPGASAEFPKAEFNDALAKLLAIRQSLSTMQPLSSRQDQSPKPAPSESRYE